MRLKTGAQRALLSEKFHALALECERDRVTIRRILLALGVRGHGFVVFLFTAPFLLPVPVPGLPLPFGLVAMFSGFAYAFGIPLVVPKRLARRVLPGALVSRIFKAVAALVRRIEKLLKPRWIYMSDGPGARVVVGLSAAVSAFVLALPLPPGTNLPPALVCVLLGLGMLERDGVVIALGLLLFAAELAVIAAVLVFGASWLLGALPGG